MPHSIPQIPRVDFVQALVLGAGVPERTKAQPLPNLSTWNLTDFMNVLYLTS